MGERGETAVRAAICEKLNGPTRPGTSTFIMLTSILIPVLSVTVGFMLGMLIGADETNRHHEERYLHNQHVYENNTKVLEQEKALLERENTELSDANEEWSTAYDKLSAEFRSVKSRNCIMYPGIAVLGGILLLNAISIYASLILKAKL